MDDLSRFCCQNSACPEHGKRGGENLSVCDHYGPNRQRRMLRCRTCKARFSERKGTPLFGANLPEEKVAVVLGHVAEGWFVFRGRGDDRFHAVCEGQFVGNPGGGRDRPGCVLPFASSPGRLADREAIYPALRSRRSAAVNQIADVLSCSEGPAVLLQSGPAIAATNVAVAEQFRPIEWRAPRPPIQRKLTTIAACHSRFWKNAMLMANSNSISQQSPAMQERPGFIPCVAPHAGSKVRWLGLEK
jgi:hypothetical protein